MTLSILHFPEQNEEEGQDEQPFPFFLSFTIERIARREMRIKIAKTIKVPMFIILSECACVSYN